MVNKATILALCTWCVFAFASCYSKATINKAYSITKVVDGVSYESVPKTTICSFNRNHFLAMDSIQEKVSYQYRKGKITIYFEQIHENKVKVYYAGYYKNKKHNDRELYSFLKGGLSKTGRKKLKECLYN